MSAAIISSVVSKMMSPRKLARKTVLHDNIVLVSIHYEDQCHS